MSITIFRVELKGLIALTYRLAIDCIENSLSSAVVESLRLKNIATNDPKPSGLQTNESVQENALFLTP